MDTTTSLRSDFILEPGSALTLPHAARGAVLAVLSGRVWLTESEEPADHFIAAGAQHRLPRRGRVVIECDSVEAARVQWVRQDTRSPIRGDSLWWRSRGAHSPTSAAAAPFAALRVPCASRSAGRLRSVRQLPLNAAAPKPSSPVR
jgi:Protein of unknown function (DUF2917)